MSSACLPRCSSSWSFDSLPKSAGNLRPSPAKLRLLILLPQARGLGIGGRLTDACIDFARAKGYRKMVLWTQSHLEAARAIYKSRGFQLTATEPNHAFGHDLESETWELKL